MDFPERDGGARLCLDFTHDGLPDPCIKGRGVEEEKKARDCRYAGEHKDSRRQEKVSLI
ncbi:hypothetical protein D3C83_166980 [compost metagenome]